MTAHPVPHQRIPTLGRQLGGRDGLQQRACEGLVPQQRGRQYLARFVQIDARFVRFDQIRDRFVRFVGEMEFEHAQALFGPPALWDPFFLLGVEEEGLVVVVVEDVVGSVEAGVKGADVAVAVGVAVVVGVGVGAGVGADVGVVDVVVDVMSAVGSMENVAWPGWVGG